MPGGVTARGVNELSACWWVRPDNRAVGPKNQALALAGVDSGVTGPAEQGQGLVHHWAIYICIRDQQVCVVCMVAHRRGRGAIWQHGGVEGATAHQMVAVGSERLQVEGPQDRGQSATLLQAVPHREPSRLVPVDHHAR